MYSPELIKNPNLSVFQAVAKAISLDVDRTVRFISDSKKNYSSVDLALIADVLTTTAGLGLKRNLLQISDALALCNKAVEALRGISKEEWRRIRSESADRYIAKYCLLELVTTVVVLAHQNGQMRQVDASINILGDIKRELERLS